ncbi:MAG: hypothetical protein Q7S78_01580 [Candidatus Azambacteria bacterium]|nr:hypothetical protein [Candidatus Azambacteria bacterium]
MFKWFTTLLASISSFFIIDGPGIAPPLNTAIISYQETYYAPVVADPENFPRAKITEIVTPAPAPVTAAMPAPAPTPPPPAPIVQATPPQDPFLAMPEPMTSWLSMNLTMIGGSNDTENPRTLPEILFDREYWRIEIFAYWAPDIIPPKPEIQSDYFKLEIYEKGTNKLVHTITSGKEESVHKFQSFRKPGTYYFKVYTKNPSKWEISFVVSPKIAQ